MKRKIVQQGTTTLMVSLPSKWVKRFGLKKGDEVEVEDKGNHISVFGEEKHTIEIDISKLKTIDRPILSAYKKGIDEIKLIFNNPEFLHKIQREILLKMPGFEIISSGKGVCTIKDTTNYELIDIEDSIKKIISTLALMSSDLNSAIKNKETSLEHVSYMDLNIIKYANFSSRYINKRGVEDSNNFYYIITSMEELGDLYKELADRITNEKLFLDDKTFQKLDSFIKELQKQFFKKDWKTLTKLSEEEQEFLKDLDKSILKEITKKLLRITENLMTGASF